MRLRHLGPDSGKRGRGTRGPRREVGRRTPKMNCSGKSDRRVAPTKLLHDAGRPARGTTRERLARVRQVARPHRKMRFSALLHHGYGKAGPGDESSGFLGAALANGRHSIRQASADGSIFSYSRYRWRRSARWNPFRGCASRHCRVEEELTRDLKSGVSVPLCLCVSILGAST